MSRPRKDTGSLEPMRHCHDCGAATRDYRCPACRRAHLARWRRALGIENKVYDAEHMDDCYTLEIMS